MKSIALQLEKIFGVAVITCIIIPGFIVLAQRIENPLISIAMVVMALVAFLIDLVLVGFIKISKQKQ